MIDKQKWGEILGEIEELCDFHEDATCGFRKCSEFNNRVLSLLAKYEDMKCYQISDRLMDVLGYCSPRIASHCDNARVVKGILERIKDKVRRNLSEYE